MTSAATPPHERAKPLAKGSTYPAKDLCSQCGLCDSRWVAYVKDSCAFLNQRFDAMEAAAHGCSRDLDNEDELYFGVQQRMVTARLRHPIAGAQWTGIVSRIGVRALESGLVDAVLCVGQRGDDRAEIAGLDLALGAVEQVSRFHVAVHDPVLECEVES